MNLLTLVKRPFCNFCNAVCGFTWSIDEKSKQVFCKKCSEDPEYIKGKQLKKVSLDKKEIEHTKTELEQEFVTAVKKESQLDEDE